MLQNCERVAGEREVSQDLRLFRNRLLNESEQIGSLSLAENFAVYES